MGHWCHQRWRHQDLDVGSCLPSGILLGLLSCPVGLLSYGDFGPADTSDTTVFLSRLTHTGSTTRQPQDQVSCSSFSSTSSGSALERILLDTQWPQCRMAEFFSSCCGSLSVPGQISHIPFWMWRSRSMWKVMEGWAARREFDAQ